MNKILLILLSLLPMSANSATCPEGMLDGKFHAGGEYPAEFSACYKGKIYPKNLQYCAVQGEVVERYRGQDGFYSPLDYKCVEGKVIGKNQDVCNKDKLGPGGVYGNIDFYCNKGGIYSKLNNRKIN